MNFWDKLDYLLYVVVNDYWGLIALACLIILALPYVITMYKQFMRDINE